MICLNDIRIPLEHNDVIIKQIIEKKIGKIKKYIIIKKAVDARDEVCFKMNFHVESQNEIKLVNMGYRKVENYQEKVIPKCSHEVVIVGAGPAGLFAGLVLAYSGAKPVIFERGKSIIERDKDIDALFEKNFLNPNSNIAFGLGGAGTYSDGKLTTNINNEWNRFILNEFVKYGAPKEILYAAKPHIGTDILKKVVSNIADAIISLGGKILYSHSFVDFEKNDIIENIVLKNDEGIVKYKCNRLILAIGHSAHDTYKMLQAKKVFMEQKPFSMGVRIEHKQEYINDIQYKIKHHNLPPAEYKMAVHLLERDVYTFCMCPGGIVVPSMHSEKTIVTNGMSYHNRDLENANAAILVNVKPSDFDSTDALAGIHFQEKYERKAYDLTGSYKAPISLLKDFLEGNVSTKLGSVKPSYPLGYEFSDLSKCLPDFVVKALKEGFYRFDKKMHGFLYDDAVLTAIESRSSSPVRITRNDEYQASIRGIYPCGEGAGYSGGIITSALDGIKVAMQIIKEE